MLAIDETIYKHLHGHSSSLLCTGPIIWHQTCRVQAGSCSEQSTCNAAQACLHVVVVVVAAPDGVHVCRVCSRKAGQAEVHIAQPLPFASTLSLWLCSNACERTALCALCTTGSGGKQGLPGPEERLAEWQAQQGVHLSPLLCQLRLQVTLQAPAGLLSMAPMP